MNKKQHLLQRIFAAALMCAANPLLARDNCTGYDVLVTSSAETLEVAKGHSLTVFRSDSVITSEDSIYHLTTGECSGTVLATPDGKVRVSGFCARRDKDGDTQSIEFSQAPGADKGTWRSTDGTGKFANKRDFGWFQDVRTDGKMQVSKWGGTCS
jgi:hypothetical protein